MSQHTEGLNCDELIPFLSQVPRGIVAMEAAGAAHFWSREIAALGHETKLIPPKYVTPFRKGNKNDAKEAEAICEAAQRPNMRFAIQRTQDHLTHEPSPSEMPEHNSPRDTGDHG